MGFVESCHKLLIPKVRSVSLKIQTQNFSVIGKTIPGLTFKFCIDSKVYENLILRVFKCVNFNLLTLNHSCV